MSNYCRTVRARHSTFIVLEAITVLGGALFSTTLAVGQVSDGSLNRPVVVVGSLELAGDNYFLDPRFVLVTDQNARVPVTSWAPLEVPPPPPNMNTGDVLPVTMREYLHKQLSITGIQRVVSTSEAQPSIIAKPGDTYIEVNLVLDVASGLVVYDGTATTAQSDGTSGGTSGQPPAVSATGPQQNDAVSAPPLTSAQPTTAQQIPTPPAPQNSAQPTTTQKPTTAPAPPLSSAQPTGVQQVAVQPPTSSTQPTTSQQPVVVTAPPLALSQPTGAPQPSVTVPNR